MDRQPSAISGVFKRPFAEQTAYFRGKLGKLVPTAKWDDIAKEGHDHAFMVAGAAKADLLTDLAASVDRSISEGKTLEAFRKDFMTTIQRNGWQGFTGDESTARRAWRTRIIYTTNATTSYNAGRYAQIKEGGFTYKIYHHNDIAQHPRPQHLAWDGLTLPEDHPFWDTHSPQNGWGCHCYISGARSEAGAKRLGGDSQKPLPGDWDAVDPKTGEPVGIDKGWGYAPGKSVADEVRKMAAKTRQWDYTIAKAYMRDVPAARRDELVRSYRALPSVADDVRRYARRVLNNNTAAEIPPYKTMGLLTSRDAATVKELTGQDAELFDYALDRYAPRHILSEHGDISTEAARGQRAVVTDDYARLPELLNAPDQVEDGGKSWRTGHPLVRYKKRFGDEEWNAVFEIRRGRKMMNLDTLFIRKIGSHDPTPTP